MITTSRYASAGTRRLARSMAEESGERYVARGKKTIESLAQEARRQGDSEIKVIEERAGKAAVVATLSVDEIGKWRWAGERPAAGMGGSG